LSYKRKGKEADMKPAYKAMYLREKARREFYERLNPKLAKDWELLQDRQHQLQRDMGKAVLYGTSGKQP
jgi:hypothetical protein